MSLNAPFYTGLCPVWAEETQPSYVGPALPGLPRALLAAVGGSRAARVCVSPEKPGVLPAVQAACGGRDVPGVAGRGSVQRPVLIDKLKPRKAWAGERKSRLLIKTTFLFPA